MRRKTARPYGQSVSGMRLVSMLMASAVLWMLYERLKDPATWRVIAEERETKAQVQTQDANAPDIETLVPGPNDRDEDEVAATQKEFERVDDRAPLKSREMGAYWKLMDWSRTQPFDELEKRAKDDVPFTQLWEQPEKYRGKLIRLRLHVRRVLEYDAPENSSGIAKVYEAWGWTDESRSFPYVVVFTDAPAQLPIGTDIRAEMVFVGYFLKVMTYKAFDNTRGAPLLVGRARMIPSATTAPPSKTDPMIVPFILIVGIALIGISVLVRIRSRGKSKVKMLPTELTVADSWSLADGENPFGQFGVNQATEDNTTQSVTSNVVSENPTQPLIEQQPGPTQISED